MQLFGIKIAFRPKFFVPADKPRIKKVLYSVAWVIAALAFRIFLPVPGKALTVTACVTTLSGFAFVRFTPGDWYRELPYEHPNAPRIATLVAFTVQPYSGFLGGVSAVVAGCLFGFYISRLPIDPGLQHMAGI